MWTLILLAFLPLPQDLVHGLETGESVRLANEVDLGHRLEQPDRAVRFEPREEESSLFVRVLHAYTGVPLEGVEVELYTEDLSPPAHLELRVSGGRTSRDGTIALKTESAAGRAQKARLRARGFASRELGVGSGHEEIRLFPEWPLRGRIIDLEGNPVVGAEVRSRQSCKHAVNAASARTDAEGRFLLRDYPADEHSPDLEIVPRRHTPLLLRDDDLLRWIHHRHGELELVVARKRPVDLVLLAENGEPAAERRLVSVHDPLVEAWTDEQGNVRFPATDGERFCMYEVADRTGKFRFRPFEVPQTAAVPIRLTSKHYDPETSGLPATELTVRVEGGPEDDEQRGLFVLIASDHGYQFEDQGTHAVPRGWVTVTCGLAFSGWEEETRRVLLDESAETLVFHARKEPVLSLTLPGDRAHTWLQAGDDSAGHVADEQPVPSDREITLFAELENGERRLCPLGRVTDDMDVDLTADEWLLRPALVRPREDEARQHFLIAGDDHEMGLGFEVYLNVPFSNGRTVENVAPDHIWSVPGDSPFFAKLSGPDHVSCYARGVTPTAGKTVGSTTLVTLPRLARVRVEGDARRIEVGGRSPQHQDDSWLLRVAPGPLHLIVHRELGEPLVISLELAPGAERRLVVP